MTYGASFVRLRNGAIKYGELQHQRIQRCKPIQITVTFFGFMDTVYSAIFENILTYFTHKDSIAWLE